jgi:hypothetical protein
MVGGGGGEAVWHEHVIFVHFNIVCLCVHLGSTVKTKTTSCDDAGRDTAPQNVECSETVSLIDWLPLEHNDR